MSHSPKHLVRYRTFCSPFPQVPRSTSSTVASWKRPIHKRTTPAETLTGATVAAIRYVRHSPAILKVLVRTGAVLFLSSALFALLATRRSAICST